IRVEVDKRQSTSHFKAWLARHLNLDVKTFTIVKHYTDNDDGYAVTTRDEEETDPSKFIAPGYTIKDQLGTVAYLRIKLNVPLAPGEKPIRVLQFDLEQPDKDKMAVLFDVPAAEQTTTAELLEKCQSLLRSLYGTEYKLNQLKLRHMDQKGVSLLGEGTLHALRGDSLWFRNLYLQIIDEEKVAETERGVPVMVRRWFANKLEVGPVSEVR
ncbi:ubiquitin carboxyl-terminal hydrolase, partial [Aphelenchoides avenae]